MKTITKYDLSKRISEELGVSLSISDILLNRILDNILEIILSSEKLHIKNFGTFSIRSKKERPGRNISKNETISIPPKNVMKFSATRSFRNQLNS